METLKIKNHNYIIYDCNKIQKLKNGIEFKFIQSYKIFTKPSFWDNKKQMKRHQWIHQFKEIESKRYFGIEVDWYDNPISISYLDKK
jgi:hypothetical protein